MRRGRPAAAAAEAAGPGPVMGGQDAALRFGEAFGTAEIVLQAVPMGEDLAVTIAGGERPHIGAVAVAQPRPSLADPDRISATTSVIALLGHKEDMLARAVASRLAAATNRVVTVACGIHYDALAPADLAAIEGLVGRLADRLLHSLAADRRR